MNTLPCLIVGGVIVGVGWCFGGKFGDLFQEKMGRGYKVSKSDNLAFVIKKIKLKFALTYLSTINSYLKIENGPPNIPKLQFTPHPLLLDRV